MASEAPKPPVEAPKPGPWVQIVVALIGACAVIGAAFVALKKPDPPAKPVPHKFAGIWAGSWSHTVNGGGRMDGVIGDQGQFSGTFFLSDGKAVGSFVGTVHEDGRASFTQSDYTGRYTGEGVVSISGGGRLVGTIEHRREGQDVGSFQLDLGRK